MSWKAALILNENRNPKPLLANVLTALRESPEWAGALAYNEFAAKTTIHKELPWGERAGPADGTGSRWSDQHDRKLTEWLQRQGIPVQVNIAGQAALTVAMEHPYHPCRDYLRRLEWDSTRRVDSWLSRYLGVEPGPYSAGIGRRWLVSAVARILRPGSKADAVMVLEGEQGIQKSTAARILFDPWFSDQLPDTKSKDAYLQLAGMWCIELAEIDRLWRVATASYVKSFLSSECDRYRPPYGRSPIDVPRSSVFLGTTNKEQYSNDETGNRRLWPVRCEGAIDVDALSRERDQLWAEAVFLFDDNASWWVDSRELAQLAKAEVKARYEPDPWDADIEDYIRLADETTVQDILLNCIKKDRHTWVPSDQTRVAKSLHSMGWRKGRWRAGSPLPEGGPRSRQYGYRKDES